MSVEAGAPEPLGVTLTPDGVNVAVFSANATAIDFCLYDSAGATEISRTRLPSRTGDIFHGAIPGVAAGACYGLRVEGPYDPGRGHRFDASKLLADPYAALFDRAFALHPSMFAHGQDSGPFAPKCIVAAPSALEPGRIRMPWADTIPYELNPRAFTRLAPHVPPAQRGTLAGLAHPRTIAYLVDLGVTSVEIMPIDAIVDERHLPPLGLSNAWGYNPVILGAPDPRIAPGGWAEVRAATDALRAAGLETILDIVLNHSGESDELGPTLSFRGLDNAAYYRLAPDPSRYINDMGCGNCIALDRPPVVAMALAALRRWMIEGGFDGFRFDLATAMGRRDWGFDAHAPLLAAIAADPVLSRAKLIAEPWDIGPGGYQLGHFPPAWGEWNDRYRDAARKFWRGDHNMRGEIATRIAGSRDVFGQSEASRSINFVTAHDGFTLRDLVSYEHKHNEANGEGNRDGSDNDYSWNNGVEGPSDDPAINAARARDMRNLLALLMISRGAPMLSMGAEVGHSQRGNNNAYAQDNEISWLDWAAADLSLLAFAKKLIVLRRAHPALCSDAFLRGEAFDATGLRDVEWRGAQEELTSGAQWEEPEAPLLTIIFASPAPGGVDRVAIVLNRGHADAQVLLPPPREGMAWRVALDASKLEDSPEWDVPDDDRLTSPARSTLIICEVDAPARRLTRKADGALIDTLARAVGIGEDWWDVSGAHTIVSRETKIALLNALRLPAALQSDARESLARLVDDRDARTIPWSLVGYDDAPMYLPLRGDAPPRDFAIETDDGRTLEWRIGDEAGLPTRLADGRDIVERSIALPALPAGRHVLRAGPLACKITIAPRAAYLPPGAARKRFGFTAQLYAQRRGGPPGAGDQGIGDLTTLGMLGEAAGRTGAAVLGVSPLHALFPGDRERASPYHPSDRRFIDPIHIDALDRADLPLDEAFERLVAANADGLARAAQAGVVNYEPVWRLKEELLRARWRAFERARQSQPGHPLFSEHAHFIERGGDALRRFAIFQAISAERPGDWRGWPEPLRRANPDALEAEVARNPDATGFALFCQWLADRQLAGAAARARAGGLEVGLYRDLAIGSAPDGAETWSRADELAEGVSVGAPPDPFSANGQVWHVLPPDPLAAAREGWRGLCELYSLNMRHAGLLRIDHAMGLERLFVIPAGASAAQGAYLSYPLRNLIGNVALESHRHKCMIVAEDLGTVPEGFCDTIGDANFIGMRVLWFERKNGQFTRPPFYTPRAIACATTHDLPTLAGWWIGADIAERARLGLMSAADEQRAADDRAREKRELIGALSEAGLVSETPEYDQPLTDALAGAVHSFIGAAASILATAQVDDLAGETIATNLPGTDRERPNWRHRLADGVDALFSSQRAVAIINALSATRR